jgi:hypothetical protein
MVSRLPTPTSQRASEDQRSTSTAQAATTAIQWQPSPLPPEAHASPQVGAKPPIAGPSAEELWVGEFDEADISKFPSLQHAFQALVAAYRTQRHTFNTHMTRWKAERQVWPTPSKHLALL